MGQGFTGKDKKFHPIGGSKGSVSEKDLNIDVKGNNDVIKVDTKSKGMKSNKEPWKQLSEPERKELIPRIWNETLTEDQKNAALDVIVGDKVKLSEYRKLIYSNWSELPEWLQNKLLDHYRWRTTLEYDGSNDHGWNSMTEEEREEIVRKGAVDRRQFSNIAVWNDSFTGTYDEKSPLLKSAFEKGLRKQKILPLQGSNYTGKRVAEDFDRENG